MRKINYTWSDLSTDTGKLAFDIAKSGWSPELIFSISAGCAPALILSNAFNIPMYNRTVDVKNEAYESDWTASEWAYSGTRILVVNAINDSGAELEWLVNDWQNSCIPDDPKWPTVWGDNVKFAVLLNNEASSFKNIQFTAQSFNRINDEVSITFPWEIFCPKGIFE